MPIVLMFQKIWGHDKLKNKQAEAESRQAQKPKKIIESKNLK